MAQVQIPFKRLNSGYDIPVLGYGTWVGLNEKGDVNYEDISKMVEALKHAIDVGYRHIDTAHLYRVEGAIGDAVAEKLSEGKLKREDLFITTKVWQHMHAPADVEKSLRASLKRLRTDYVDLFLMHWPMAITEEGEDAGIDYLDTWRGMEEVQKLGLARSIGVSNFNVEQLKRLAANSTVTPAMNQVELNLNLGQRELVEYCTSAGVAVTAYTPFGTMLPARSPAGSPEPKVDSDVMVALSKKYNKTATQIALRYIYQRGVISIPKTLTKNRVLENASIFDFELSPEDVATLARYDCGYRTVRPAFWQDHPHYPFEKVAEPSGPIPEVLRKWQD